MNARHGRWAWGVGMAALLGLMRDAAGGDNIRDSPLLRQVTCTGTVRTTYTPGLTDTSQDTQVTTEAIYPQCVAVRGDAVVEATAVSMTNLPDVSCGSWQPHVPLSLTLTWNTGEESTLAFNARRVETQGTLTVATLTGTVVTGKFQGASVLRTVTHANADLIRGCHGIYGLTESNGQSTLVLVQFL